MALSELDHVRRLAEPYLAQMTDAATITNGFRDVGQGIRRAYLEVNPDADDKMRAEFDAFMAPLAAALELPELAEAYAEAVPCVETLVATELDAKTGGERGLGRVGTSPPRFAGAFRKQLSDPTARAEFGQLIEQFVFRTYAATAAALQTIYEPPTMPSVRPAEEVFEAWVPNMYVGTKGFGEETMDLISAANSPTEEAFETAAERHGLLSGMRKKTRRQTAYECGAFWVAAGAALYWTPAR